ncbi:peptidase [Tenacibaculum sp. nBUS_03]|uniref:peptidase n=1 Tax=Tenacibaculum sp. nBUS_03 TaxID=3395320 RepID=UPI003EBEF0CC
MFFSEIKSNYNEDISILIKPHNHPWNYICECGDASNLTVKEIQNTNAIFISHTHIDHFVNFDAIIRHQIGSQRRIVICGPKNIATQVQHRIKSYTWNLIEKETIIYEIREMISDNEIHIYEIEPPIWELKKTSIENNNILYQENSFTVTGVLLDHKTPSLSYKFKEKDTLKINLKNSSFKGGKWVNDLKNAFLKKEKTIIINIEGNDYQSKDLFHLLYTQEGDSLGIIMDHAANFENHSKIKKHFFQSNKVYIECFYKNEDKEYAILNYHSYSEKSGEIMNISKINEAIPVHFSRKYNEQQIDEIISEFKTVFKN